MTQATTQPNKEALATLLQNDPTAKALFDAHAEERKGAKATDKAKEKLRRDSRKEQDALHARLNAIIKETYKKNTDLNEVQWKKRERMMDARAAYVDANATPFDAATLLATLTAGSLEGEAIEEREGKGYRLAHNSSGLQLTAWRERQYNEGETRILPSELKKAAEGKVSKRVQDAFVKEAQDAHWQSEKKRLRALIFGDQS